jgi:hypothetical protein
VSLRQESSGRRGRFSKSEILRCNQGRGNPRPGEKQRAVAVDLYRQKKRTIDEICKAVGFSRPTLSKYVAATARDR